MLCWSEKKNFGIWYCFWWNYFVTGSAKSMRHYTMWDLPCCLFRHQVQLAMCTGYNYHNKLLFITSKQPKWNGKRLYVKKVSFEGNCQQFDGKTHLAYGNFKMICQTVLPQKLTSHLLDWTHLLFQAVTHCLKGIQKFSIWAPIILH